MPEYRRFIAYFYEYINGKKQKNAGFAKVELRNGMWRILFRLTTEILPEPPVKVYGFVREQGYLLGFPLGAMRNACEIAEEWAYRADSPIGFDRYRLEDLAGIWILSGQNRCFITVWDDDPIEMEKFVLELPREKEAERAEEPGAENGKKKAREQKANEADSETREGAAEGLKQIVDAEMGSLEAAAIAGEGMERVEAAAEADGGMRTVEAAAAAGVEMGRVEAAAEMDEGMRTVEAAAAGAETGRVEAAAVREMSGVEGTAIVDEKVESAEAAAVREMSGVEGTAIVDEKVESAEAAAAVREISRVEGTAIAGEKVESAETAAVTGMKMRNLEAAAAESVRKGGVEAAANAGGGIENVEATAAAVREISRMEGTAIADEKVESAEAAAAVREISRVEGTAIAGEKVESVETAAATGMEMRDSEAAAAESARKSGVECAALFEKRQHFQPFEDQEIENCIMIFPCDVIRLQQEGWQAGRSSFLQHAYYQYRHLLLGTQNGAYVLGVPGIRSRQEQYMAQMFGYNRFKMSKICDCGRAFGYWYRILQKA